MGMNKSQDSGAPENCADVTGSASAAIAALERLADLNTRIAASLSATKYYGTQAIPYQAEARRLAALIKEIGCAQNNKLNDGC